MAFVKKSGSTKNAPDKGSTLSRVEKARARKKNSTHTATGVAKGKPKTKNGKKKVYTAEELGVPKLNMITPAGVSQPKGKKKGKTFVDDKESMMTILAMVNADKEGQIESKMMKARQMEEIREARRKEAEARQEEKRSKLEETKDSLRRRRSKHKSKSAPTEPETPAEDRPASKKRPKKSVSFG